MALRPGARRLEAGSQGHRPRPQLQPRPHRHYVARARQRWQGRKEGPALIRGSGPAATAASHKPTGVPRGLAPLSSEMGVTAVKRITLLLFAGLLCLPLAALGQGKDKEDKD